MGDDIAGSCVAANYIVMKCPVRAFISSWSRDLAEWQWSWAWTVVDTRQHRDERDMRESPGSNTHAPFRSLRCHG